MMAFALSCNSIAIGYYLSIRHFPERTGQAIAKELIANGVQWTATEPTRLAADFAYVLKFLYTCWDGCCRHFVAF